MQSNAKFYKGGGLAAVLGIIVLFVSTALHPLGANPGDVQAAFLEYSGSQFWVTIHLGQLLGILLIGIGLFALAIKLHRRESGMLAILGAAGTMMTLAIAGVLQAVDGVALKVMVDRLLHAGPGGQPFIFEAVFAVRQIEIGMDAMLSLFMGLTVLCYAGLLFREGGKAAWLGILGVLSGIFLLISGVATAHDGFADTAMMISMLSSVFLLAWVLGVGIYLWKTAFVLENSQN